MSVDLSAAVEAANKAMHADCGCGDSDDVMEDARVVVTAAAPLIAQAVREQVAREIEEFAPHDFQTRRLAYEAAARIARGTP